MRLSIADAAIVFQWSYEDKTFVGHISRNSRFGGGNWQAIAHGSTLIEALGEMKVALELEAAPKAPATPPPARTEPRYRVREAIYSKSLPVSLRGRHFILTKDNTTVIAGLPTSFEGQELFVPLLWQLPSPKVVKTLLYESRLTDWVCPQPACTEAVVLTSCPALPDEEKL